MVFGDVVRSFFLPVILHLSLLYLFNKFILKWSIKIQSGVDWLVMPELCRRVCFILFLSCIFHPLVLLLSEKKRLARSALPQGHFLNLLFPSTVD